MDFFHTLLKNASILLLSPLTPFFSTSSGETLHSDSPISPLIWRISVHPSIFTTVAVATRCEGHAGTGMAGSGRRCGDDTPGGRAGVESAFDPGFLH